MKFTRNQLREFQALYLAEIGRDLPDNEVEALATRVVTLVALIHGLDGGSPSVGRWQKGSPTDEAP